MYSLARALLTLPRRARVSPWVPTLSAYTYIYTRACVMQRRSVPIDDTSGRIMKIEHTNDGDDDDDDDDYGWSISARTRLLCYLWSDGAVSHCRRHRAVLLERQREEHARVYIHCLMESEGTGVCTCYAREAGGN